MTSTIQDHATIGDCSDRALVAGSGSIDAHGRGQIGDIRALTRLGLSNPILLLSALLIQRVGG
jgi:hypothetical protein